MRWGLLLLPLVLSLALLAGCSGPAGPYDTDEDGSVDNDDCAPADPSIHPNAVEALDGIDNDCDGVVDEQTDASDDDNDGFCEGHDYGEGLTCIDGSLPGDCDDADALLQVADADGDGQSTCEGDCDDGEAARWIGNAEVCDGLDNDCDGTLSLDEQDTDGDGATPCDGDCDDGDPDANILDEDADGFSTCEQDCDDGDPELTPGDADGDGWSSCLGDCDDLSPLVHPEQVEVCDHVFDADCLLDEDDEDGDGVDADGDGDPACSDCDDTDALLDDLDVDGDGFSSCGEPADCNDLVATTHPGADDPWNDTIDSNCDGLDGIDGDGDGFAGNASAPFTDCDDTDPALNLDDVDGDGSTTCDGDCDDADPTVEALDADGDGVTTCDSPPDCRDDQPTVFPGAVEVCDPWDTDCDPSTTLPDDGVDADGDGFAPCDDCDDGNTDTWPGAPEICDGEDNDCSGGFPIHGPDGEWDNDGDGWSDCEGDCGDFDDTVHPGAVDDCDGEDTDCDGIVDNLGDSDGDGWCAGDCDDGDPARHPGQWETVDGVDSDCDGTDFTGLDQEAWAIVDGAQDVFAGSSLAGGGDIDGDLFPDILIGAPGDGPTMQGRTGVFRGVDLQAPGSSPMDLQDDAWASLGLVSPAWAAVAAGASVAFLPDVDGDGLDEVAWGSPGRFNSLGYAQGGATVQFSSALVAGDDWPNYANSVTITNVLGMNAGLSLATGDVDGDGLGDLLIGGNWDTGAYLFLGSTLAAGGNLLSTDADVHFTGPWDQIGAVAVDMADFDNDGFSDLAFGHYRMDSQAGGAWLFYGYQLEQTATWDVADAHVTFTSPGPGAAVGASVAFVSDMDGDGLGELAVGGPGTGGNGAVWLISSAQLLTMGTLAPVDAWARIVAGTTYSNLGTDVASAGDLDGDGLGDLLVGVWQLPGGTHGGAWAFLGSTLAPGGVYSDTDGDFAFAAPEVDYYRVAPAGDVNADGAPDLLVANPEWEWDDRGRVWLLLNPL